MNNNLSRGGASSSSLPDELLDLFEDDGGGSSSSNSYDMSFLDGMDENEGQESFMEDLSDDDMGGDYSGDDDDDPGEEDFGQGSEKGALYDAYNLLHSLAQVSFCIGCLFSNRLRPLLCLLMLGLNCNLSFDYFTGFSKAIRCTRGGSSRPSILWQICPNRGPHGFPIQSSRWRDQNPPPRSPPHAV